MNPEEARKYLIRFQERSEDAHEPPWLALVSGEEEGEIFATHRRKDVINRLTDAITTLGGKICELERVDLIVFCDEEDDFEGEVWGLIFCFPEGSPGALDRDVCFLLR